MSDDETHTATKNGNEYEVVTISPHENAHGSGFADENSSKFRVKYECFDCGTTVFGETVEEARSELAEKPCEG